MSDQSFTFLFAFATVCFNFWVFAGLLVLRQDPTDCVAQVCPEFRTPWASQ